MSHNRGVIDFCKELRYNDHMNTQQNEIKRLRMENVRLQVRIEKLERELQPFKDAQRRRSEAQKAAMAKRSAEWRSKTAKNAVKARIEKLGQNSAAK